MPPEFQLHSLPGANHTIYLDFDGHVTSGTPWNDNFTGGADFTTISWSQDGDPSTFNGSELNAIYLAWLSVSEDFMPFEVNVTTEDPGVDALVKSDAQDTQWGVRVVIGPEDWYPGSAGGATFLNSWNWNTDTPAFVFNSSLTGIREAVSHEVGRSLSLRNDGDTTLSYYSGHGSGETSWSTIMGVGYYVNVSQWSKGEYPEANNTEDDIAIITSGNWGFGYREDDHGSDGLTATRMIFSPFEGGGIIEQNTDVDVFEIVTSGGQIDIAVQAPHQFTNLDVAIDLVDATTQQIVASDDPLDSLSAAISTNQPAGVYWLYIDGVGRPQSQTDPDDHGYSDYGSLGEYVVTASYVADIIFLDGLE
ncbi:MAG: hypothetical protein R3E90_10965 [Marinicella sp.]